MFVVIHSVRDSSVIKCGTHDRKVTALIQGRSGSRISSLWSTFCADSYFGICSTFVLQLLVIVHKIFRSFCQKWRWQVTAKHTCSLHAWF